MDLSKRSTQINNSNTLETLDCVSRQQQNLQPTCNQLATDTISRQAAIDALGEEPEVWTGKDEYAQGLNNQWHYDRNAIMALPSAQPTQEIIHCKDCRFWKKYKYFNGKPTYAPFCGFNSIFTDDNDFCSRAEKRGEAE
jgi:hypothetical protein